jgi:hypothetical protein
VPLADFLDLLKSAGCTVDSWTLSSMSTVPGNYDFYVAKFKGKEVTFPGEPMIGHDMVESVTRRLGI